LRGAGRRFVEAAGGELDNGFYLFTIQAVIPFHDVVDVRSGFQILKDGGHRHACALQDPRTAHLAGNALHRRTLRPIETCHGSAPSTSITLPAKKEKANLISQIGLDFMPATTYSPTHFRVQYNRPCGA